MQFKKYTKQRNGSIQGLRSFKDTLPKNIKKVINKKGHIYSETLSNWKYIVGDNLFKVCYPKSFKNSNRFGVSTLLIMVKRGHEVDLEYSKKEIMDKMVEGKVRRFLSEVSLLSQDFVKDPEVTVMDYLTSHDASIVSFSRFKVGEGIEVEVKDFAEEVAEQLK